MKPIPENIRLLKGAYWLTKLRSIAIVCVIVGTYVAGNILSISLHDVALYEIATVLILYSIAVLIFYPALENWRGLQADQYHASRKRSHSR